MPAMPFKITEIIIANERYFQFISIIYHLPFSNILFLTDNGLTSVNLISKLEMIRQQQERKMKNLQCPYNSPILNYLIFPPFNLTYHNFNINIFGGFQNKHTIHGVGL